MFSCLVRNMRLLNSWTLYHCEWIIYYLAKISKFGLRLNYYYDLKNKKKITILIQGISNIYKKKWNIENHKLELCLQFTPVYIFFQSNYSFTASSIFNVIWYYCLHSSCNTNFIIENNQCQTFMLVCPIRPHQLLYCHSKLYLNAYKTR